MEAVQNIKQIKPDISPDFDYVATHYAITIGGKRTTVAIEGYLIKPLVKRFMLSSSTEIRRWIEKRIDADAKFNANATGLTVTAQVKRIIVEAIV